MLSDPLNARSSPRQRAASLLDEVADAVQRWRTRVEALPTISGDAIPSTLANDPFEVPATTGPETALDERTRAVEIVLDELLHECADWNRRTRELRQLLASGLPPVV